MLAVKDSCLPPLLSSSTHILLFQPRIRDSQQAHQKAEGKIDDLQKQLESNIKTNQALLDEHQALQMAFNSQEKKLKETEQENDRLVS